MLAFINEAKYLTCKYFNQNTLCSGAKVEINKQRYMAYYAFLLV